MRKRNTARKSIFLTGITGYLGSYLAKLLLQSGCTVYALVRRNSIPLVQKRLEFWSPPSYAAYKDSLKIVAGDISSDTLKLAKKQRQKLGEEIDEIYHSAANTDLRLTLEQARAINLQGTANILKVAGSWARAGRLRKVNHMSTAYVCGDFKDKFSECDLDVGQRFLSTYEQSKFEAEQLVHRFRNKGLWIDIFRPSIIVGESSTGKTFQFKHIYQFLHLLKQELFSSLPLMQARVSMVPIDEAAKAVVTIAENPGEKNKTFHIFPCKLVDISKLVRIACEIMKFKRPLFVTRQNFRSNKFTFAQQAVLQRSLFAINTESNVCSQDTLNIIRKFGGDLPDLNMASMATLISYFHARGIKSHG